MLATEALTLPCRPAFLVRSADELRLAMRRETNGPLAYDASTLDRALRFDAARGLVEVQAATTWSRLAAYLGERGAFLAAFAEDLLVPATVGECVAANAPGPDGLPMNAHVEALTLVTPDGELRRVTRQANGGLFALALGGQGVFGALYSATLQLGSLARSASARAACACLELPRAPGLGQRSLALLAEPLQAEALIADARALAADWRVALEGVAVRRTLAETETRLRWAAREFAWVSLRLREPAGLGGAVRMAQLSGALIDAAISRGGSYPISCTPDATRAQAQACYPGLGGFLAEKRRYDPAERLQNAWYRHHRGLLGREACPVRFAAQEAVE